MTCQVGHCTRRATYRVTNGGTGKEWDMCAEHAIGYSRDPRTTKEKIT